MEGPHLFLEGTQMVWELTHTGIARRTSESVEFGMSAWRTRDYEYVREVLFDGAVDRFTVNLWRRQRDK